MKPGKSAKPSGKPSSVSDGQAFFLIILLLLGMIIFGLYFKPYLEEWQVPEENVENSIVID